jgi:hypothetical protein
VPAVIGQGFEGKSFPFVARSHYRYFKLPLLPLPRRKLMQVGHKGHDIATCIEMGPLRNTTHEWLRILFPLRNPGVGFR